MITVIVILVLVFHVSEGGPWKGEIKLLLLASSPHFSLVEAPLACAEFSGSGPTKRHSLPCLPFPGPKPSGWSLKVSLADSLALKLF